MASETAPHEANFEKYSKMKSILLFESCTWSNRSLLSYFGKHSWRYPKTWKRIKEIEA